MSSGLPSFVTVPQSPPLEGAASAIAIVVESSGKRERVVHGAYRVATADRGRIGRDPVRHQVWLVLLDRPTAEPWAGRPGAGVTVFEGEEPAGKPVEGHFSVDLQTCVALEASVGGTFDLIAVLGPWRSAPITVQL